MESRKNALLTTEDRRWLTGEKAYRGEHAKQQRYQRRRDIRERIYNSLLDFTVLFDHLEDDERERVFGQIGAGGRQWESPDSEFENGVRDALAFISRGIGISHLANASSSDRLAQSIPDQVVTDAMVRACARDDLLVEDVTLEIEAVDRTPADVRSKLESGDSVSKRELHMLLESDQVDGDAFQDCLRSALSDEPAETEDDL